MAVVSAMAFRTLQAWLRFGDLVRIFGSGGRMAMRFPPGSHSTTSCTAAHVLKSASWRKRTLTLLFTRLSQRWSANSMRFVPRLLAPYTSIAKLVASEQDGDRLNIRPVLPNPCPPWARMA
jgi:hypothetical protein